MWASISKRLFVEINSVSSLPLYYLRYAGYPAFFIDVSSKQRIPEDSACFKLITSPEKIKCADSFSDFY